MTIIEAINRTDNIKPNGYSQADKIKWLSTLDGEIKSKILDTHEGNTPSYTGYEETTPIDTELLVPAPYDVVYIHYLSMQIDYANGEYGKYNNSMSLYNSAYSEYERYYKRDHMPKSRASRFLF